MNSIAFRLNNEDESDVLMAKNNPEQVRHAILRTKYRAAILEKERELQLTAKPGTAHGRRPVTRNLKAQQADADLTI